MSLHRVPVIVEPTSSQIRKFGNISEGALDAGAITASVASATSATLEGDGASGGSTPYSYQWHRSTTQGFTPGAGNEVSGFTSLSETDTGLTESTTYYYKLVVTDGASNTATSAEASVTPTGATYPNQPPGFTTIQQISDGTTKTIDGFGTWGDKVAVVNDAANPLGTGKALRWTLLDGERNAGLVSRSTWPSGPFTEMYFMLRINYESTWEEVGHKVWGYWGSHPDSRANGSQPTQFYCTHESNRALKITVQNSAPNTYNVLVIPNAWPAPGTGIHTLEVYCKHESNSLGGNADGICRVYMDGTEIGENTGVQWVSAGLVSQFQGLHWYANKNTFHTQDSHFRVLELLASGVAA